MNRFYLAISFFFYTLFSTTGQISQYFLVGVNNTTCMTDDGTPPSNGLFNINDSNNFMYHTSIGRVNRIRHYQWKKILTGIYKN